MLFSGHCRYLCAMRKLSMDELNRMTVEAYRAAPKHPVVVVLENVRSMQNVGSVFRTADAFRITSLMLCGYTPQPPHRDIHKTALGATETVSWQHFADAPSAIRQLKAEGYRVWGVEQVENSQSLETFHWNGTDKLALVLGNEAQGVEQETLLMCDGCIEIPQFGMKHSLNISVAAGIVLWHLISQHIEP